MGEKPKRFTPGRLEITLTVVAGVTGVGAALAGSVVPAGLALLITAGVLTSAWAVIVDEVWRHRSDDFAEGAADGDRDTGAASGLGLHRRWLIGIVTPMFLAIVLNTAFDSEELLGGSSARLPGPLLLPVVLAVAPWIAGMVTWLLLVAPGRLILSGSAGNGTVRLFAGVWIYLMVAGAVAGSLAVDAASVGRSSWMADRIGALLGIRNDLITSPGWLLAARTLFGVAFVVLPVAAWIASGLAKRRLGPQRGHQRRA